MRRLYRVDLSQYEKLKNTDLIDHINRVGVIIYSKIKLADPLISERNSNKEKLNFINYAKNKTCPRFSIEKG